MLAKRCLQELSRRGVLDFLSRKFTVTRALGSHGPLTGVRIYFGGTPPVGCSAGVSARPITLSVMHKGKHALHNFSHAHGPALQKSPAKMYNFPILCGGSGYNFDQALFLCNFCMGFYFNFASWTFDFHPRLNKIANDITISNIPVSLA